jgi:predicted CoA-binding protein
MILTNEQAATIRKVLRDSKNIAVVGLSPKPHRPSHQVASYLMEVGYTIVDMVDIFRRQEAVLPIVEDAISIGAQFIWMQEGIINKEAAAKAETAGLTVIMNRCTKIDHMNLL